jgi:hypothetical protein
LCSKKLTTTKESEYSMEKEIDLSMVKSLEKKYSKSKGVAVAIDLEKSIIDGLATDQYVVNILKTGSGPVIDTFYITAEQFYSFGSPGSCSDAKMYRKLAEWRSKQANLILN